MNPKEEMLGQLDDLSFELKDKYALVATFKTEVKSGSFVISTSSDRIKINEALVLTEFKDKDNEEYKPGDLIIISEHAINGMDYHIAFPNGDTKLPGKIKKFGLINTSDVLGRVVKNENV